MVKTVEVQKNNNSTLKPIRLNVKNQSELIEWLEANRYEMNIQHLKGLLYMHHNNLSEISLVRFIQPDSRVMGGIIIFMNDYNTIIEHIKKSFIDSEHYEEARITQNILDILKNNQ